MTESRTAKRFLNVAKSFSLYCENTHTHTFNLIWWKQSGSYCAATIMYLSLVKKWIETENVYSPEGLSYQKEPEMYVLLKMCCLVHVSALITLFLCPWCKQSGRQEKYVCYVKATISLFLYANVDLSKDRTVNIFLEERCVLAYAIKKYTSGEQRHLKHSHKSYLTYQAHVNIVWNKTTPFINVFTLSRVRQTTQMCQVLQLSAPTFAENNSLKNKVFHSEPVCVFLNKKEKKRFYVVSSGIIWTKKKQKTLHKKITLCTLFG